ncbi:MAG TPA: hypothetical protein VLT89_08885 [Usitatibacter sp.]|nr:hypothetical protein [Usitatibacter sp.]
MRWTAALIVALSVEAHAAPPPPQPQDSKGWLEKENLEVVDAKTFNEFEAVIAHPKDSAEQRAVIFMKGKPAWQSTPKDTEPGSKWTIVSIGRDLEGKGSPDVHFSTNTGGPSCCTTHYVFSLKPKVQRLAIYAAGSMGGGDFIEVPGRKTPVMISADDSSANAFAPYANSYFPLVVLEVGSKGRLQFAQDMMQARLPGMPPPVCSQPFANTNPWLKERCAEYASVRRHSRTQEIKSRLAAIKANRSADKLKWEDYFENGVLSAVSAEINRYTYTGHGAAGMNWLETVWPGNDAVKVKLIQTLRMTQAKSVFAEDLKAIATN